MKRIKKLSLLLVGFFLFSAVGCTSPSTPSTSDNSESGIPPVSDTSDSAGEDTSDIPQYPETTPSDDPTDLDIFGAQASSRPLYNDTDEFLGESTSNGVYASSVAGTKAYAYTWEDTDKYALETALIPFWRSQNVYNETVTFKSLEDEATLLYAPTKIISVYDYYLETEYKQGEDFVVEGNKIRLTQNTKINYWKNYYNETPNSTLIMPTTDGKFIYASETEPNKHQISISYEHNDTWKGVVPQRQSAKIAKTLAKLKNGETVKIGVIGDSITYGRGSSGDFGYGSKTPRYATLVYRYLKAKYPTANIVCENVAVGGTASAWGSTVDGIGNFTIKPDLFIVAFGMNDMYTSVETYYDNMNKIVAEARKINVNSEIVLVSSMLPNPEVMRYDSANPAVVQTPYGGNIPLFEDELIKISNENTGIAVVPMTSVTTAIYATGKRFEDVNSNNLNHPNDYIHRIYAQTVLKVMLGDEFTAL